MVAPEKVMETLKRVMLVDGFDVVIDFEKSSGSRIVDARTGKSYLDMFSMVASQPLGMNHPRINEPEFVQKLGRIAVNKPSNADIYSSAMAEFVKTFAEHAAPSWMKYLFFVSGGTLAVENAIKVAFDWKVRLNQSRGIEGEVGSQVLHFKEAFHGRSGYTLSLTNTDPNKTKFFPKFDWPRIDNPKVTFPNEGAHLEAVKEAEKKSLAQIATAISERGHDIAALILEPIQGEGGDNHFRPEFFQALRKVCDENDILFILDEVQTGLGMTGRMWAHEHYGIEPDIIAFGKKTQVCGIAVGPRVDEVADNCFVTPSRINSTWGGNLVDMVRCTRIVEIIRDDNLVENAASRGQQAVERLSALQTEMPDVIGNVRGKGLFVAFDLKNPEIRSAILQRAFSNGLMILPAGTCSIRLRPALNVSAADIDEAVDTLRKTLLEVRDRASAGVGS